MDITDFVNVPNPLVGYQLSIDGVKLSLEYVKGLIEDGVAVAIIAEDGSLETVLTKDFDETAGYNVVSLEDFTSRMEEVLKQLNYRWN